MATSAAIQYTHPYLLEQYFPSFSAKIGTGTIWDRIEQLHTNFFTKRWDVYDDTIETILELQLTQYDDIISKRVHDYTGAIDAYNILKDNPDTTYVLNFW